MNSNKDKGTRERSYLKKRKNDALETSRKEGIFVGEETGAVRGKREVTQRKKRGLIKRPSTEER